MTLKDLKLREASLLNSHRNNFEEYGKALKDIIKMCEQYGGPRLSETMLISDMAYKFIEREQSIFELTKNENCKLRIKAASELCKYNYMPFEKLYEFLNNQPYTFTYEEACDFLKQQTFYEKVHPEILLEVINKLKEENEVREDSSDGHRTEVLGEGTPANI